MKHRDETVKQPTWCGQLSQVSIPHWEQLNVNSTDCGKLY